MLSITSEEFFVLSARKLLCCFDKVCASIPSFERERCFQRDWRVLSGGCEKFRILLGNVAVKVGHGMMKALNCKVRFCV